MAIDTDKLKTDSISIISDWAEAVIMAQLSTSFSDSGFTNLSNFTTVSQSGSNTINVDFQSLSGRDRYLVEDLGLSVVDLYKVFAPFTITVKQDYYILRYTGNGDTGTGTGSLNTMTDSSKTWTADDYIGYYLIDSAGTIFEITDSSVTTLTVSGTPASGTYYVSERYQVKHIAKKEDHAQLLVQRIGKDHG